MKSESEGLFKGDICNRNECDGILNEHEKEGSCSCHIHPPCSYCTYDATYCPKCGWSADEEMRETILNAPVYEYVPFKVKTFNDLDRTKIDWIPESHTHFSMIKKGVFPKGTTMKDVEKIVCGTFGGRFEYFNIEKCEFKYIAYTD